MQARLSESPSTRVDFPREMQYFKGDMPTTPIELELRKLGLSEKEARVYLASLELGNTSVQSIAKKVNLSRPTAYRTIESLQEKGLIEKPGKKSTKIIARSPDELLGMLRAEKRRVEEKEREFIRIISALKTKYAGAGKNEIKIFSGKEGEKFLFEELSATNANKIISSIRTAARKKSWKIFYSKN